jgi:hypothetical protein
MKKPQRYPNQYEVRLKARVRVYAMTKEEADKVVHTLFVDAFHEHKLEFTLKVIEKTK